MDPALANDADRTSVRSGAFGSCGNVLGMSQADLGAIIGEDRTAVRRGRIDPDSEARELALLFIRCYRALCGGRRWPVGRVFATCSTEKKP